MELNDSCFAYPALRKFPIHTKEDAESSLGAYRMQKNAFSEAQRKVIEANFEKAAAYHGFSMEKQASVVENRPEIWFKGAENGVKMTEIRNFEELGQAADYLIEKRASVPRAELAEAAKYVLWQSANHHEGLDEPRLRKIAHIAGIGVGDRDAIQREFEKRATTGILSRQNREAFWKFANEMKALSDDEFFLEQNLNTVCDVIDSIDFMRGDQHKHASELGYPEDVVFKDTLDDLVKQASDMYTVPSIDMTLSKTATLERKDAVNAFLARHFNQYEPLDGDKLIEKVAALEAPVATALIEAIE